MSTRPAAVAGLFYPDDPDELRAVLHSFWRHTPRDDAVGDARTVEAGRDSSWPKAIVAPHAGYVYSGPIAASAYRTLEPARGHVTRVVLLGPAHTVPLRTIAAPSVDRFATPLGDVRIDTDTIEQLVVDGLVVRDDTAHAREHALEVHLPFIQVVLGDVAVVPLVVGAVPADHVARVLDAVWDDPSTVVVVSSDLSHYHDHDTATRLDRATAQHLVARDAAGLDPDGACGHYPLRGLLTVARRRDLDVEVLDLRNSGDTAGPHDRVVGYGAFAVR